MSRGNSETSASHKRARFNLMRNPVVARIAFYVGMLGVAATSAAGWIGYNRYEQQLESAAVTQFNQEMYGLDSGNRPAVGYMLNATVVCKGFTIRNPVQIPLTHTFKPGIWVGFEQDPATGQMLAHQVDLTGCDFRPNPAD